MIGSSSEPARGLRARRSILAAVAVLWVGAALTADAPYQGNFWLENTPESDPVDAALAMNPIGDAALVYTQLASGGGVAPGLVLRRFAKAYYVKSASTVAVAGTEASDPAVGIAADGSIVVVWVTSDAGADGSGSAILARRYDPSGAPLDQSFQVNADPNGDQSDPAVAMALDGRFTVTWLTATGAGSDVRLQAFAADGAPLGAETTVNETTAGDQTHARVAVDKDANPIVVWEGPGAGGVQSVFARRFGADGLALSAETPLDAAIDGSRTPAVARHWNGAYIVTWQRGDPASDSSTLVAQRYTSAGAANGAEIAVGAAMPIADGSYSRTVGSPSVVVDALDRAYFGYQGNEHWISSPFWSYDNTALGTKIVGLDGTVHQQYFGGRGPREPIDLQRIAVDADGDMLMFTRHDSFWHPGIRYLEASLRNGWGVVDFVSQVTAPTTADIESQQSATFSYANAIPPTVLTGIPEVDSAIGAISDLDVYFEVTPYGGLTVTEQVPGCGQQGVAGCRFVLGPLRAGESGQMSVPLQTGVYLGSFNLFARTRFLQMDPLPSVVNTSAPITTQAAAVDLALTLTPPTAKPFECGVIEFAYTAHQVGTDELLLNPQIAMTLPITARLIHATTDGVETFACQQIGRQVVCGYPTGRGPFTARISIQPFKKGKISVVARTYSGNPDVNAANNVVTYSAKVKSKKGRCDR